MKNNFPIRDKKEKLIYKKGQGMGETLNAHTHTPTHIHVCEHTHTHTHTHTHVLICTQKTSKLLSGATYEKTQHCWYPKSK